MSDATTKIRFIQTDPRAEDHEGMELLNIHRRLCGPTYGAKTEAQQRHEDQVQYFKKGYNGGPIYELTCPICGIRWRR